MKASCENIVLKIPAQAEYIEIVRLTLYGVAARMNYSYEDIEDMKVAVSEACNNSVLHAYSGDKEGSVEVRFEIRKEGLSIVVRDEGSSFDYNKTKSNVSSLHNKSLNDIEAGGLGIYMMQALMDVVQVNNDFGTEVTLTKLLNRSESTA